jgi:hypothetical protein
VYRIVASPGATSEPQRTSAGGDDDGDDDEGDDGEGSSGPIGDFTFGSGTAQFVFVPGQSQFQFEAVSGPNGENATGFAEATSVFGVTFAGPVTCLRVSATRAAFEVDSNDPFDVVFFVGDNGPAGMGDEFNFHPLGVADGVCPDPNSSVSEQSVRTGDIVVRDNAPLPGSGGDDDDDDDRDD